MTENVVQTEKPLYKCVVAKSIDTTKKIAHFAWVAGLYAICIVCGLAIAVVCGFTLGKLIEATAPFLIRVPWYVYIATLTIMSIPAYSTIWCLNHRAEKKNVDFNCQED